MKWITFARGRSSITHDGDSQTDAGNPPTRFTGPFGLRMYDSADGDIQ